MDSTRISARESDHSPQRERINDKYRERSRERLTGSGPTIVKDQDSSKESLAASDPAINREERGRPLERTAPAESAKDKQDSSITSIEDEDSMMKLMGFGSFGTTKNKHVSGMGSGSVKKNKKAEFRQYMNRDKGFNRALSPERKK